MGEIDQYQEKLLFNVLVNQAMHEEGVSRQAAEDHARILIRAALKAEISKIEENT